MKVVFSEIKLNVIMNNNLLLLFTISLCTLGSAQNVDNQKVSFQYIQLPKTPFSTSITSFRVITNSDQIALSNEDSLNVYNARLLNYQTEYDQWYEQKKAIDKSYYIQLTAYEKAVNAGNTTVKMPEPPHYPLPPLKEDISYPILSTNVDEGLVQQSVSLEGFNQGNGEAEITLDFYGMQNARIEVSQKASTGKIDYTYKSSVKYPIHARIEVPGVGVVYDKFFGNTVMSKTIGTYQSKYEYAYWKVDNYDDYWKNREIQIVQSLLSQINADINDLFGYPIKYRSTEVYTVKKFKNHHYSDLVDAYVKVKSGYDLIVNNKNHAEAKPKIMAGIQIWEQALSESNLSDSKSRINDKVTALLYYNLAEAYMWLDEFETAEAYRLKAENGGVNKFKNEAKALSYLLNDQKARFLANN